MSKEYIPIIGLEIHSELKTNSKMFCSCKNDADEINPNKNVCPICMAHPGTLPTINKEAVKKVTQTGIALNCKINKESKFDRKNYFYPDLPKGYQISQYDLPICGKGYLDILKDNQDNLEPEIKNLKRINITRIHLEEDTARLLHPKNVEHSLVDFNRAGVPLMELVTDPDIRTGKEAKKFGEEFKLLLKCLNVSDADMEKGQMRIEANISLGKMDENNQLKFGTKVEIKNLNSFRVVEKAIDYEIKRQGEVLEKGEEVIQETRGWVDDEQKTISQRIKEEAHDYRYFPEPDLLPMLFDDKFVNSLKNEIPELPWNKRFRFREEYNLDLKEIDLFVKNNDLANYFEKIISEIGNWIKADKADKRETTNLIKIAKNYLISELIGLYKGKEFLEIDCKISPENFAEFTILIFKNSYPSNIAKQVLVKMFETGQDPSIIIEKEDLNIISDESEIQKLVEEAIRENQSAVDDFRKGKENAIQFLVGKVMAKSKGRATPDLARKLLQDNL